MTSKKSGKVLKVLHPYCCNNLKCTFNQNWPKDLYHNLKTCIKISSLNWTSSCHNINNAKTCTRSCQVSADAKKGQLLLTRFRILQMVLPRRVVLVVPGGSPRVAVVPPVVFAPLAAVGISKDTESQLYRSAILSVNQF